LIRSDITYAAVCRMRDPGDSESYLTINFNTLHIIGGHSFVVIVHHESATL